MVLVDARELRPAALQGFMGKPEQATTKECVCRGWRRTLGQQQADTQMCLAY